MMMGRISSYQYVSPHPETSLNMDPTYPLVPIANVVACILVLVSLSKNLFQSWNIGACSFAIWIMIMSISVVVNAAVWANNIDNVAPVWCDISEFSFPQLVSVVSTSSSYKVPEHIPYRDVCFFFRDYTETFRDSTLR